MFRNVLETGNIQHEVSIIFLAFSRFLPDAYQRRTETGNVDFVRNDFSARFYQLNLLNHANPPHEPCVGLYSGAFRFVTRAVGIGHRYKHLQSSVSEY
jgi:hypothetical protein